MRSYLWSIHFDEFFSLYCLLPLSLSCSVFWSVSSGTLFCQKKLDTLFRQQIYEINLFIIFLFSICSLFLFFYLFSVLFCFVLIHTYTQCMVSHSSIKSSFVAPFQSSSASFLPFRSSFFFIYICYIVWNGRWYICWKFLYVEFSNFFLRVFVCIDTKQIESTYRLKYHNTSDVLWIQVDITKNKEKF